MPMGAVQERFQRAQDLAVERNAGHVGIAIAGVIMAFVACPMSIVAIAAPYWGGSTTLYSVNVKSTASLWSASTSMEGGPSSAEQSVDMCGDEMEGSNIECGKIHAVRFFEITALLMAIASAAVLLVAFSPIVKAKREQRPKLYFVGVCIAGATLLWHFLSFCVVASVDMPQPYSLNGAGFVFLILLSLLITAAIIIVVLVLRHESPKVSTTPVEVIVAKADSSEKIPNLLEVNPSEKQAAKNNNNSNNNNNNSNMVEIQAPAKTSDSLESACEEP